MKKFFFIFLNIFKKCDFSVFIRFTILFILNLPSILQSKNLKTVYYRMGIGPFNLKINNKKIKAVGYRFDRNGPFSGFVEVLINEVYNFKEFNFRTYKTVVDLGAGNGNFINFIFAHNYDTQIIAVEPRQPMHKIIYNLIEINSYKKKNLILSNYFVGDLVSIKKNFKDLKDFKFFKNGKDFIKHFQIKHIDFLKIDIEGSEYSFLEDGSILNITQNLAIEIHEYRKNLIFWSKLKKFNFEILSSEVSKEDAILLAKKVGCGGRI